MVIRSARIRIAATLILLCSVAAPAIAQEFGTLTAEQQELLAPLAEQWEQIPQVRKDRLLNMADRVADGTPAERERFQQGLDRFLDLDPTEQRQVGRLFNRFRHLPPGERQEIVERVMSMPEGERQAFAFGMRIADRTRGAAGPLTDRGRDEIQHWLRGLPPERRKELLAKLKDLPPPERLRRIADEMEASDYVSEGDRVRD